MSGPLEIPYEKWDATGNDFVVVDLSNSPLEEEGFTPEFVRRICHRQDGVGADGLVLLRGAKGVNPAEMVIWNSDGSRGEMCGNALRCVALILARQGEGLDTPVRVASRVVRVRGDLEAQSASIAMGPVEAERSRRLFESLPNLDEVMGGTGYLLSFGNPHYVVPLDSIPADWANRGEAAQDLAHEALGTGGINCGFLQRRAEPGGYFPLRVFERGAGVTRSCGSGACAASAVLEGPLEVNGPHRLELLGGTLEVGRTERDGFVLSGPAHQESIGRWIWP